MDDHNKRLVFSKHAEGIEHVKLVLLLFNSIEVTHM